MYIGLKSALSFVSVTFVSFNCLLFCTAIEDGDYLRALTFLESLEPSREAESMWKTLAELSLQEGLLKMAER